MLKNYQVVIFKDQHGTCRKLRFRGWLFAVLITALAAVVAGDIFLIRYFYNYKRLERELAGAEKLAQDQNTQLVSLADKVKNLDEDLTRIRTFDARLRRMVNLDQDPRDVAPAGGEDKDFNTKYLPLYRQEMLTRKLHQYLSALRGQAGLELARQERLLSALAAKGPKLAAMPASWPVEGWISSGFGERISPFTGKKEFHKGLDIVAPVGTPVLAAGAGTVTFAGEADDGGVTVTIDHKGGITTSYGHLRDAAVTAGQTVERGQNIGHVGDLGQATGPHLHYEARQDGVPVDPARFIPR